MSTLSKVFVVLVLLASIVFAMTSMARLATTENYKEKYSAEADKVKDLQDTVDTLTAQRDEWKKKQAETERNLNSQITARDTKIGALETNVKQLETELGGLKDNLGRMSSDLTSVKGELAKARADNERLHKDRDAAVKRAAEYENAKLDAEQRLKESQNRVKNLLEDVRNKDLQITQALTENKALRDRLIEADVPLEGSTAPKVPPIRAVVTEVKREATEVWVQISVGKVNDVKEGMKFILYGDGVYKGDMQVSKVFDEASVGKLTQSGAKEVAEGDQATTDLRRSTTP